MEYRKAINPGLSKCFFARNTAWTLLLWEMETHESRLYCFTFIKCNVWTFSTLLAVDLLEHLTSVLEYYFCWHSSVNINRIEFCTTKWVIMFSVCEDVFCGQKGTRCLYLFYAEIMRNNIICCFNEISVSCNFK